MARISEGFSRTTCDGRVKRREATFARLAVVGYRKRNILSQYCIEDLSAEYEVRDELMVAS
jgi:hypothetical protein